MLGVRSVAIGILVDAGPSYEAPEQAGLAHLIEHLMFHGTSSRDAVEIAQFMDVGGGNIGAFTSRDYVCYFATVLDDYRTYALDLLGDILLNSIFPEDRFEREKSIVLHELESSWDSALERAHMRMKSTTWPDHNLGRPILGSRDTVSDLTREDAIYFVNENYLPDRIIIAAAGNVEHDDFTAQVRDAFWRLQGRTPGRESSEPAYHPGFSIEHLPVSQAYFSIGMRAYPYTHPDRYQVHLLNEVVGGGISSRLYRELRDERGLAYHIGSEYHAYKEGGLLVIEGSTAPEYLNRVLALTFLELEILGNGDDPVSDDELWKAKMHLKGQHLIANESSNTRMSRLATQEFYFGKHIPSAEILGQIESVDAQQFNRIASGMISDAMSNVCVSVVGPETPGIQIEPSIREALVGIN